MGRPLSPLQPARPAAPRAGARLRLGARWALLVGAALSGCGGGEPIDTGYDFRVVSATPDADAAMVTQAEIPSATWNSPADPTTCTTRTVRLDAVDTEGAGTDSGGTDSGDSAADSGGAEGGAAGDGGAVVLFHVEGELSFGAAGDSVQYVHAELLPRGFTYAFTIAGGDAGCLSSTGAPMAGFSRLFAVP